MFFKLLTSFCTGIGTKNFQVHIRSHLMMKWFPRSAKLFRKKHSCEKLEGAKFFIAHVMTFVATPSSFRKPITPWHDHLPFSFQAYSSSMSWSPLSITLSFLDSHMPIFLIRIHPFIFFHSFFLANKTIQFPFWWLHYPAFFFIHIVATKAFSSIVLPIILYNSRWLMWESLRPTFQQVLPHRPRHLIWDID